MLNRRRAAAIMAAPLVIPSVLVRPAHAWVPLLLRLLLQGTVRGSATRTVTTTVARTLAAGVTRTVATSFQTVASLGITGTSIVAVSAGVWALANQHRVKQIWVTGTDALNSFLLASDKATTEHERIFIGYRVVDTSTGVVEAESRRVGFAAPGTAPLEFPFEVKPLPNPGLKRVEAFVTVDEEANIAHPRYVAPEPQLVVVAHRSEVTYG